MKRSKTICGILCMLMLLQTLAGCQSTETETDAAETEQAVQNEEAETVDERLLVSDNLPEKDFDGQNFTLYLRKDSDQEPKDFVAEEGSGDILVDAVYKRNLAVSERFNVNFQYNYDTSGNTTYNTTAVVAIKAGDDANDLLGLHGAFCFNHVKEGLLLDWNSYMEYNDLTKPWWDADFCSNMTIVGKLYGMTGTISHTSIGGTFCLMFNKDMMDTLGIAYPYDSVKNGTWTFDAFQTMCSQAAVDLNGDGAYKPENDQFGLESSSWGFPVCSFYLAGNKVITPDAEGKPELTLYNEQTVAILEKMRDFYDSNVAYISDYHGEGKKIFEEGRALFAGASMGTLETARDYDVELGVVPYPKYDESISRYYSLVDAGQNVFSVPIVAQRLELISVITEALAAEGYKTVVPAFYEIGLKTKYARDTESAEMLEIITESRYFDYGYFDASINWNYSYIGRSILFDAKDFTSFYQSTKNAAQENLDKLYEQYLEK